LKKQNASTTRLFQNESGNFAKAQQSNTAAKQHRSKTTQEQSNTQEQVMLTKPSHRHVPHLLKVETPASFLFDPCDHFQETLAVTSAISKVLRKPGILLCAERTP